MCVRRGAEPASRVGRSPCTSRRTRRANQLSEAGAGEVAEELEGAAGAAFARGGIVADVDDGGAEVADARRGEGAELGLDGRLVTDDGDVARSVGAAGVEHAAVVR